MALGCVIRRRSIRQTDKKWPGLAQAPGPFNLNPVVRRSRIKISAFLTILRHGNNRQAIFDDA
jgi:hypothetical protein